MSESDSRSSRRHTEPPKRDYEPELLIRYVQRNPILWQPGAPGFQNSSLKDAVWQKISKKFWDVHPEYCKKQWETIKSSLQQFRRRKEKREVSGAPASTRQKKHFKWHKELSFLPPVKGDDRDGQGNFPHLPDEEGNSDASVMYTSEADAHCNEDTDDGLNSQPTFNLNLNISPAKLSLLMSSSDSLVTPRQKLKVKGKGVKTKLPAVNLSPIYEEGEEEAPIGKKASATSAQKRRQTVGSDDSSSDDDLGKVSKKTQAKIARVKQLEKNKEVLRHQIALNVNRLKKKGGKNSTESILFGAKDPEQSVGVLQDTCLAMKRALEQQVTSHVEDEHTLFCLSMAIRMRKLPPVEQRIVTQAFVSAMSEAEGRVENIGSPPLHQSKPKKPAAVSAKSSKAVVTHYGVTVREDDMLTLKPGEWLNDQVINFYLQLVADNSPQLVYSFNTWFFDKLLADGPEAALKWTKKVALLHYHVLIMPVNTGNHWCLILINLRQNKVTLYDSLGEIEIDVKDAWCDKVLEFLEEAAKDIVGQHPFDTTKWSKETEEEPKQGNLDDCGAFVCERARCAALGVAPEFSQADMHQIRQRMWKEITHIKLII